MKYQLSVCSFSSQYNFKIYENNLIVHNCVDEAEREAVNAAERAERKQHLREKVSVCFWSLSS